jgi:hypothetical protein
MFSGGPCSLRVSVSPPCMHVLVRSTLSSRARLPVCAATVPSGNSTYSRARSLLDHRSRAVVLEHGSVHTQHRFVVEGYVCAAARLRAS